MTEQQLLEQLGLRNIALALGIKHPSVCGWRHRGIPLDRLPHVCAMAGVDPADVRPDVAWIRVRGKVTGYVVPIRPVAA